MAAGEKGRHSGKSEQRFFLFAIVVSSPALEGRRLQYELLSGPGESDYKQVGKPAVWSAGFIP